MGIGHLDRTLTLLWTSRPWVCTKNKGADQEITAGGIIGQSAVAVSSAGEIEPVSSGAIFPLGSSTAFLRQIGNYREAQGGEWKQNVTIGKAVGGHAGGLYARIGSW